MGLRATFGEQVLCGVCELHIPTIWRTGKMRDLRGLHLNWFPPCDGNMFWKIACLTVRCSGDPLAFRTLVHTYVLRYGRTLSAFGTRGRLYANPISLSRHGHSDPSLLLHKLGTVPLSHYTERLFSKQSCNHLRLIASGESCSESHQIREARSKGVPCSKLALRIDVGSWAAITGRT